MLAANFKRTKIVATVGPATDSAQLIYELVAAGANCIRFNMSHDTHASHARRIQWAREAGEKAGKPVAVLVDLQGPKIRVGNLPPEGVKLTAGEEVRFKYEADYSSTGLIPIQFDFSRNVRPSEIIYLDDGWMQAEIKNSKGGIVTATVKNDGTLLPRKGINLPDTSFDGNILTKKDLIDLKFAAEQKADYIGLSFVQRADDVFDLKQRLKKLKSKARVVAKIETKSAIKNLEAIMDSSDAMMVARGDLALEILPEQVPVVQQHIVKLGQKHQKPVIVATQMLDSMTHSLQPTRAEVSDVATAVMQGADSVMLSGETTVGQYPVATVVMMKRIIVYTQTIEPPPTTVPDLTDRTQPNAISAAAILLARQLDAKVILAETLSGKTARNIASFRPPMPIMMPTPDEQVYRQLAIVWGGRPYLVKNSAVASEEVIERLKSDGNVEPGDSLVIASGHQPGVSGGTDTIKVRVI